MLSLKEAIDTNRLPEFIRQEERRGMGPVKEAELFAELAAVITQPRSEDQT